MVYQCEHCDYLTNRQSNFLRHKNRKNPCDNTSKGNKNVNPIDVLKNTEVNVGVNVGVNDVNANVNGNSYKCDICLKCFSTRQGKFNHKKFVNCTPPTPPPSSVQQANVINNHTTNNNTTNNINNSNNNTTNNNINNNNIQINVFGNEDLNYLLNDKNIIQKLKSFGKSGIYGLPKILNEIHFNKDMPENNTLIKPEEYGNGVMIMNDDKEWEYREFEDIRENLINTIVQYFKAYNTVKNNLGVKLIEKRERNIVKNFAYELMSLEGTIPPDLFQELEMNEEEIEEGEEEMKNKIRKFDKSTMKSIHRRTSLNYKKENGSYVKK